MIKPVVAAKSRPRGRPFKLGDTEREIIVALVAVGCSRRAAARYLKIAPQTISNEAARDPQFARRLDHATAVLSLQHLKNLRCANGRSWRASAWVLERLMPAQFADPTTRAARESAAKQHREGAAKLLLAIDKAVEHHLPEPMAQGRLKRQLAEILRRALKSDSQDGSNTDGRAA